MPAPSCCSASLEPPESDSTAKASPLPRWPAKAAAPAASRTAIVMPAAGHRRARTSWPALAKHWRGSGRLGADAQLVQAAGQAVARGNDRPARADERTGLTLPLRVRTEQEEGIPGDAAPVCHVVRKPAAHDLLFVPIVRHPRVGQDLGIET